MPTALDSSIFGPLFTDQAVVDALDDQTQVRAVIAVEIALARAEARLGIIPSAAAEHIAGATGAQAIDMTALAQGTMRSGFPIIALVEELRRIAGPQAAPYVHFGATTQDIMDSAAVLQLRVIIKLFADRLAELSRRLGELADQHRKTVMAGRTHGQQALPITFGLKAASWLAPLLRHSERLKEISPRLLVVQFGGAAGTLAALGTQGLAVMRALADELELAVPVMPWHAQRDSLVELAGWLSLLTGSLGKMAQDIILLAQTEVGEVVESAEAGRGQSSTMPQKRNPIASEIILAAARANAGFVSAMHHAQIHEHERATHGWQLEWLTLPEMALLTGGALKHTLYLAKNLQVDPSRMRENIRRADDVVLGEAAVFALAQIMDRVKAEALVKKAAATAMTEGKPLIDIVKSAAAGVPDAPALDWQALAAPENYLGSTEQLIERVLQYADKLRPS